MYRMRAFRVGFRDSFSVQAFDRIRTELAQRSVGGELDRGGGQSASNLGRGPLDFVTQGISDQLTQAGASLYGSDFRPPEDVIR